MAKYLLVYHGGGASDGPPDEEIMAAWGAWFGELGAAVVDGGNPIAGAQTLTSDGASEGGGANPATGYSLIDAADMADALAKAKGCPVLNGGGSVEVCETIDMGP